MEKKNGFIRDKSLVSVFDRFMKEVMSSEYYEKSTILTEYLFFHYGKERDYLQFNQGPQEALHFPVKIVDRGLAGIPFLKKGRALDLGCAVGRSSFELTRYVEEVVGIDYSEAFIRAASDFQKARKLTFSVVEEVGKSRPVTVEIPQDCLPERVSFIQGDALNLPPSLGEFDFILAANLIDRLSDPQKFLENIGVHLKTGGLLILTSPYTWMESFTPQEKWLNQERGNFESLEQILGAQYQFQKREEISMLIREHCRKYQWTVTELTVWKKI